MVLEISGNAILFGGSSARIPLTVVFLEVGQDACSGWKLNDAVIRRAGRRVTKVLAVKHPITGKTPGYQQS